MALAVAFAFAAGLPPRTAAAPGAPPQETEKTTESPDLIALKRLAEARTKKESEWTGEDIALITAAAYRGLNFGQYKKVFNTGREEGTITIATTDGDLDGEFLRRYAFGPTPLQDRVRLDIIFNPNLPTDKQLRYTLTHNGASVWAAQANRYITPDSSAAAAFKASIVNDYTTLFRYADENATLTRLESAKIHGFDLEVVELKRTDGSSVRFFISPKTFHILHVEYDVVLGEGQNPTTFRESYSDWRVIQEVLVPGKRKLRQNGQLVQTIELLTGTYGQTVEDAVFLQL